MNTRFRTNFMHDVNGLPDNLPPAPSELDRWHVLSTGGENPLMIGGYLMTCLAIEHALGRPDAHRILSGLLQTLGSLYKFTGDHFDGYIVRWDPVMHEDDWAEGGARRVFYLNQDLTYNYCTPLYDPRSRRLMTEDEWNRASDAERQSRGQEFGDWLQHFRAWEPSMDELVGLMMGYDMVYRLVQDADDVRGQVRDQVNKLGDYLAEHGYYLVRPCGGFSVAGASGILLALEYPFSRVFLRITGQPYYIRNGFQVVMDKADVWKALEQPFNWWTAAGLSVGQALLQLAPFIRRVAEPAGLGFLFGTTAPFTGAQLGQIWAIYLHSEVFDVWSNTTNHKGEYDQDAAHEFALAYALSLVSLRRRFDDYMNGSQTMGSYGSGFPPFIGLTGLDDSEPNVGTAYLNWLPARRQSAPGAATSSCLASAVAVILGAGAAEEATLVDLLKKNADQSDLPLEQGDGHTSEGTGWYVTPGRGLDYMAALAVAWLHRKRWQAQGRELSTPDFPELPDWSAWSSAAVPASVLAAARSGNLALPLDAIQRTQPLQLGADGSADLFFDDPIVPRSPVPPVVLPAPAGVLIQDTEFTIPKGPNAPDVVPTGITVNPGDELELTGSGKIWAGVLLTGENGPDGWADRIEYDRKFQLTGKPNGHPYALIGMFGRNGASFYIGGHRPRERYLGLEPLELFLRINDDTPTNGSGALTCRVQVWGQRFTVDTTSVDFGDVPVACGTKVESIHITNASRVSALPVKSVAVSGAPFGVDASFRPGTAIEPGSALSVNVTCAPITVGEVLGTATVVFDDPMNPTVTVPLRGRGVPLPAAPTVTVFPEALDFGSVDVGADGMQTVSITNVGSLPLTVQVDDLNSSVFSLVTRPVATIERCKVGSFEVGCHVSDEAPHSATITLHTNDPAQPTVQLVATVQGVNLCPQLAEELKTLQQDLEGAEPGQRAGIMRQIKELKKEMKAHHCL